MHDKAICPQLLREAPPAIFFQKLLHINNVWLWSICVCILSQNPMLKHQSTDNLARLVLLTTFAARNGSAEWYLARLIRRPVLSSALSRFFYFCFSYIKLKRSSALIKCVVLEHIILWNQHLQLHDKATRICFLISFCVFLSSSRESACLHLSFFFIFFCSYTASCAQTRLGIVNSMVCLSWYFFSFFFHAGCLQTLSALLDFVFFLYLSEATDTLSRCPE